MGLKSLPTRSFRAILKGWPSYSPGLAQQRLPWVDTKANLPRRGYRNHPASRRDSTFINCGLRPLIGQRTEVLQIAQTFKAVSEDLTNTTLTLMVTGKSEKIDALKEMLIPYGVLELVRTGKVLISRGDHRTSRN